MVAEKLCWPAAVRSTIGSMPEEPTPPTEGSSPFERKVRTGVILYIALPCLALLFAWLWVKNERAALKVRGTAACVAARRDQEWCAQKADEHHERCIELTFRPGTKTASESFNPEGYVECLEVGPKSYWDASAKRARAKEEENKLPSGPVYH